MPEPVTVLLRDHTTGDRPVSSIAQILKPDKSKLKRVLKWIVIANAVLAAVGIVIGGNPDFVARVHGTSFLLVVTAASLVAIEQGKFRTEIKYVWPVGSVCSTAIGVVVIALIWGFEPPEAIGRPVGSVAVAAVAITYSAVISEIAERARLRVICWIGALGHSCYVWVLIWFEISAMPGRALALLAVAWASSKWPGFYISAAGWCFLVGIMIFSGSLYILAISGIRWLGAITPIGGLGLIIGWGLLAVGALKAS